MASSATTNFVKQQGFLDAPHESCGARYRGLVFQPRVVGLTVVLALVLQSAPLFLVLSALLWWSALCPRWNPFDAFYNAFLAGRGGRTHLSPAPPPRRFAQGMAASFMLGIGVTLAVGWTKTSWVLQGMLILALTALTFGKFCLGSYIYHLIRGDVALANRTLPWARG